MNLTIADLASVAGLITVGQFLGSAWIMARLTASIKHEYDTKLEEFRYNIRVREQAARVAEYMAFARRLEKDSPSTDYQKADQLAWELAMWLPSDVYMQMAESMVNPDGEMNPLAVVVAVRELLLGDNAGNLKKENILTHNPEIGKQRTSEVTEH